MSYGPHQVKMLKDRRDRVTSRTQDFYKQSTHKVYGNSNNKLHSVTVTESLLFDIRRRLKTKRKSRRTKIIIFSLSIILLLIILGIKFA